MQALPAMVLLQDLLKYRPLIDLVKDLAAKDGVRHIFSE